MIMNTICFNKTFSIKRTDKQDILLGTGNKNSPTLLFYRHVQRRNYVLKIKHKNKKQITRKGIEPLENDQSSRIPSIKPTK